MSSTPRRSLFWTAYCQSTLQYVASVFCIFQKRIKQIRKLQQKVLIGRPWIQSQHIAEVLSSLKVGPTCNLELYCRKANLGAALRLYGSEGLTKKKVVDKSHFLKTAASALSSWQSSHTSSFAKHFLSSRVPPPKDSSAKARKKSINKILFAYHQDMKEDKKKRPYSMFPTRLKNHLSACTRTTTPLS